MGAVNVKDVGMKVVGVAVAAFADNLAKKNFTAINQKVLGAIEIAAGLFIPKFVKAPVVQDVGDGLVAVGTINLLKSFSVISGVGAIPARVPLRRPAISPGAPAVGAAGRPFLNANVGNMMNQMSPEYMGAMGALFYED